MRALISCAFAATSVRVSPSARNFWNAGERRSASTKRHQLWSSHCPSRRSSQLVSRVSSRSTNHAVSCGGTPSFVAASKMNRVTQREVLERLGQVRGRDQLVAPLPLRQQHALGADEVLIDADAPHRVGHVLVEAREEAEAVLGGEIGAPAGA